MVLLIKHKVSSNIINIIYPSLVYNRARKKATLIYKKIRGKIIFFCLRKEECRHICLFATTGFGDLIQNEPYTVPKHRIQLVKWIFIEPWIRIPSFSLPSGS